MRFIALPLVVAAFALSSCELSISKGEESIPLPTNAPTNEPTDVQLDTYLADWQIEACLDVMKEYNAGTIELSSLEESDPLAWCEGYFIAFEEWTTLTPSRQAGNCDVFTDINDVQYLQWLQDEGLSRGHAVGYIDFYWKFCYGR